MTNRVIVILLIVLTTAALLGEAGRSVMEPEGRWREWLHLLVAQQVADTLDRQVQLGPITDLSLAGVELRSLAIAEGYFLRNGAVIRADRLQIAFDALGIARQEVAPAAAISKVRLERAWVHVVRDQLGNLNVEKLVPEPVGPPPPPEDRFQGVITVEDSVIIYDDYAIETVNGQPLNIELTSVDAEVDMREIGWAAVEVSARERLGRFGRVGVRGQTELETGYTWAKADIGSIDAAFWSDMFLVSNDIAVQRGSVDVSATIGLMPREGAPPEPAVAADVTIRDAAFTLAALNDRQVVADATLTGTMDGAQVHSLHARIGGTTVDATGFVGDFEQPIVDLAFDGEITRPDELLDLAPQLDPQTREQIDAATVGGPLLLSGTLVGPVNRANLSAQAEAPGQIRYANAQIGEIVAGPLDLRVDVLDLADPNVRGRVNIARTEAVDLEPLRASLPEGFEGPIEVSPLEDLSADVLWSAEIPVAQTELSIPRMAVGDVSVAGLTTGVSLADDVIYLSDLRAEPLGGRLIADVVVHLGAEGGPWAWAQGQIDGIELARLQELPGLDAAAGLAGEFSGSFVGEYADGTPYVVADAIINEPGYEDYAAESVRALVVVDESAVEVLGANLQDPLGVAWVRGVMPFEGEMAASFAVAGVQLGSVVDRFELDADNLQGEVFLTGSASGTPEEPRIDASLRAFNVKYQDYDVDALMADFDGGLDELRVSDLFASSGRIVARADATLSDIDLEELNAELDGTVRLAGPVDERALELAELQDEDLAGAVNVEVNVAGTLQSPSADGTVYLDYARYDAIATDEAILAVSLQGDVLQMTELRVPVGDAVVSGTATVTSLYDEPIISATVRAEDIVLQDLALLQETGLPVSGRLNLPYLNVQGPLDDLKGLAQIQATDLEVGDEPIGAVSAAVVLDRNELMLRRTTLALAGGQLALEGRYRLDEKRIMPSHVELDDVAVAELLQIAVPLARHLAGGGEAGEATEGVVGDEMAESDEDADSSLATQLASLSLRLGGRLDGTLSVEGVIPEPAAEGAETEEIIADVLAALTAEVDVSIHRPSFDNKLLPDTELHAQVADKPEVAVQIESVEGDALITADGTWAPGGAMDLLADVSALDLALLRPWVPAAVASVGGRLNLTVMATGTLDDPQFIGSIDITEPEAHGVKFDLVSAPLIRYDGEVMDVDSLVVRESDEEFFVDGRIPFDWDTMSVPQDGELQVVLRSDGTNLAVFPPLIADAVGEDEGGPLGQIEATGTFDSLVKIAGTTRRPELNGQVTVRAPSIETPWLRSPIEDLALNVSFTGVEGTTVVALEEFTAREESVTVTAGGTAEMTEYELAALARNRYDLRMTVNAAKQSLGSAGLALRDLRGEVTFVTQEPGRHLLTVDEVGADLGDGTVVVDGTVGVTSFVPAEVAQNDFDLAIVADDARPRYGNLFLGTVDGRIGIANAAPGAPVGVTGAMTLSHAVASIPLLASGGEESALFGMSENAPPLNFDVALAIGPDVRVQTTGLTAPLEPTEKAVWLRGTPQRPSVQGLVEVQEGEATVSGGVLDIETAGVRFLVRPKLGMHREPPVELEMDGRVWATATRKIQETVIEGRPLEDVLVQLQVSGTLPNHIHVQVSSTPPLADEQIYALLGAAPFSGSGGMSSGGDLNDVLNQQFVSALGAAFRAYVFQPFQEDLKKLLGLSVFEVNFAFDQPVDVRLGGYLIEDLLVTYQTSVIGATETDYSLEVSYKVEKRFELTYETNDRNDNRFLVEYVYGF